MPKVLGILSHLFKMSTVVTCKTAFSIAYKNKYQEAKSLGFTIEQVYFYGPVCSTLKDVILVRCLFLTWF